MGSYEREQARLQALLDDVGLESDGGAYNDESDKEEQDGQESLDHQSESEQDISDTDEEISCSTSLSFIGRIALIYFENCFYNLHCYRQR